MKLGRVVGTVVSTINSPIFDGRRLLLCDLLEPGGADAGGYLIAVDTVGAGAGETVLILDEGNSARQVVRVSPAPIRTVVVGIVDDVALEAERPGERLVRSQNRGSRAASRGERATGAAADRPSRTRGRPPER